MKRTQVQKFLHYVNGKPGNEIWEIDDDFNALTEATSRGAKPIGMSPDDTDGHQNLPMILIQFPDGSTCAISQDGNEIH